MNAERARTQVKQLMQEWNSRRIDESNFHSKVERIRVDNNLTEQAVYVLVTESATSDNPPPPPPKKK